MIATLLLVSTLLVGLAIPLAVYIMVAERTWNFYKLWELALRGHRLARLYVAFVGLAFVIAVIAWVFAFQVEHAAKSKYSAVPEHALQRTAFSDYRTNILNRLIAEVETHLIKNYNVVKIR
jgi:hypothetical protein